MVKKSSVRSWEWFVSLFLFLSSAAIVWTNESLDLLNKLDVQNISSGQAMIVFLLIASAGASWFILNALRHKKLI